MLSQQVAAELLRKYGKDLENLQKITRGTSLGLRSDSQFIPELLKALDCIANGKAFEPTSYMTGISSMGKANSDPQKAVPALVDFFDDRFINTYFGDTNKANIENDFPGVNLDKLKTNIVNFRQEIREYIAAAKAEKSDTVQKSKVIASELGASHVEFRVKNFNPHDPSHNARQPLETIQFEFRTLQERDAFYERIKNVSPSAVTRDLTATKRDIQGNAIPIVLVKPEAIKSIDAALFPREPPKLSRAEFIETTRSLISAGIFSGRSSRLEESLKTICEALETGQLIDGRQINAQVSGGWMASGQQKTASGMIYAEEAWAFLFQEMGALGNSVYKEGIRGRLEEHFSKQKYPVEVRRLWFDVFADQEGYKKSSTYANLEDFISDRPGHQATVGQPSINVPQSPMDPPSVPQPSTVVHPSPSIPQPLGTMAPQSTSSPLTEVLKSVESQTGKFSKYQTTAGSGENIPFTSKPAQQFLHGLGVKNEIAPLSKKADGKPLPEQGNQDVTVKSFDPESQASLVISGARIDRLRKSAKTYVNTDIFPKGHFKEIVTPGTLKEQTKEESPKTGVHLQNMAVGVCHVQEIDLLATPILTSDGKAILGPRTGTINVDDPALLLLSTPALNLAYGSGNSLTKEEQEKYIESMYRTLFHAAVSEGRQYIALPAAGLGVFGGDPETYFKSLMKIAKEFPQLNIIYNPGDPKNAPLFDTVLNKYKPTNIVRTDRDVLIVAHELTQQDKPCAFHNPSDADVVLGIYDVGEYWKNGKGSRYVGEEHIGAMSTAPLNSRHLNPKAYENVVEHSFLQKPIHTLVEEKKHNAFIQHFIQHHAPGVEREPLIEKGGVKIEFKNQRYLDNFKALYSEYMNGAMERNGKAGKAYLTLPIAQVEAMENGVLKGRYQHYATSNNENREVVSVATCDNLDQSFKSRYKQRQGDFLKSTILKDFYEDLENAETAKDVNDVVNRYKADGRYDILAKAQNTTMQVLGMTTSSVTAFETLRTERLADIDKAQRAQVA
ncbi:hypothetical protein [Legionella resiliens]|uniref:DrrA phosphatidylinositol 4-phosphate binding domain-containing protein n=1 Tax=Legionella resiliens TaxID=2905958 RepID=A0ABS8X1Z1_9GAMM|nr:MULTISPECIES: hypothetical protein [unclassified Legionella]MCE0721800.1 hypothetical protein [Legionella sp. 9fVS26]MCE3530954.1 hypothetical protein [Legionella sp. 8cVS16]